MARPDIKVEFVRGVTGEPAGDVEREEIARFTNHHQGRTRVQVFEASVQVDLGTIQIDGDRDLVYACNDT